MGGVEKREKQNAEITDVVRYISGVVVFVILFACETHSHFGTSTSQKRAASLGVAWFFCTLKGWGSCDHKA